jgi:peptidyl-tRNA hydrolase ICT1
MIALLVLNVTRVNSKATLKVPLEKLLKHIPRALHHEIKASRYVAERSNAIIIQADDSRKQNDNAHSCYARLHQMITGAGRTAVPGETSAEQAKRVKNLYAHRPVDLDTLTDGRQKADNERRLKTKKQHSAKKSSRKGTGDG